MSKSAKQKSATELFASKIVKAIREGNIKFGEPASVKAGDSSGQRYSSEQELPNVSLDVLKKEGVKNPRYVLTVKVPGSIKGAIKQFNITGHYARLAYKYITKVPAAPRKIELSNEDLELANKAFGF